MEMSQGNSLYSYLKQTKVSFYFCFTKLQNRRVEQVLSVGRVLLRAEVVEKGYRRVHIVQILGMHVCKWKLIPV
jgi:hypothetical protein